MTLLHFNARSIKNKFDTISAELLVLCPTVICITETWLHDDSELPAYQLDGYVALADSRKQREGGGVVIYVRNDLAVRQLPTSTATNDAFSVCAAVIGRQPNQMLVCAVYRAPRANSSDTKVLYDLLDKLIINYDNVIIAGDFNAPHVCWFSSALPAAGGADRLLQFAAEHCLTQLIRTPTRGDALLDLVFASPNLACTSVSELPPFDRCDHKAQLLSLPLLYAPASKTVTSIDYDNLNILLSLLNWQSIFAGCQTADEYADTFMDQLYSAIEASTMRRPHRRRSPLPKHIVCLLRRKKRAWLRAKHSGNYAGYDELRKTVKAAVRSFRRNQEERLVYARDKRTFFAHVNQRTRNYDFMVNITDGDNIVSDQSAANLLGNEFAANFSSGANGNQKPTVSLEPHSSLLFNCSEAAVTTALRSCPNSRSSPDNISYQLLKRVSQYIIRPLNIIFQHSLFEGVFPKAWKNAVVIPLYKGHGLDRMVPASYRPISLCSCIGKILERIVLVQLQSHIQIHNVLHNSQHGFVRGRSTETNILSCDKHVVDYLNAKHPYDVITFDFRKAFDKAPHQHVISAAMNVGIGGKALSWISSFLTGRTQRIRVGGCLSRSYNVVSGVVQGSVLGPTLFTILLNPLLISLKLPRSAFADDLKLTADVSIHSQAEVQSDIDTVAEWSIAHEMPLSIEKTAVLHCGCHQPQYVYSIRGQPLPVVTELTDLGVIRTSQSSYSAQCQAVAAKAARAAYLVRRAFHQKYKQLMWPAFVHYVLPILMYCASAWSPALCKDISAIERIQRRFTKSIRGMRYLSYSDRLSELGALTLQNRRIYADMILVYKALHNMLDCSASALGLEYAVSSRSTRDQGIRLVQRQPVTKLCASLFACRAPSQWNKLPPDIRYCRNLRDFKNRLFAFLRTV